MKNLKVLEDKYAPTIQKIIDENSKYYGFSNKVQYGIFLRLPLEDFCEMPPP